MLKQWKLVVGTLVTGLSMLVACTSENGVALGTQEGAADVAVRGLSASSIESMVVTAQPANVSKTLTYNADGGTFGGRLLLPAGDQELTATGYGYSDAGVVASGSAAVTIVPNTTTAVTMRIYDQTPQEPQPDIAPYIRSVTASKSELFVNESITVAVNAVDVDGDALSYAWTSDCASGTFTHPAAASTTWTSSASASCTLSVRVSSGQSNVSESVTVAVFSAPPDGGPGEGSAQVDGEYVARPYVSYLSMGGSYLYRYYSYSAANFSNATPNTEYSLRANVDFGTRYGTFNAAISVVCDGVAQTVTKTFPGNCEGGGSCYLSYSWRTPASGAVCKVTGSAENGALTDSFSAGVFVR